MKHVILALLPHASEKGSDLLSAVEPFMLALMLSGQVATVRTAFLEQLVATLPHLLVWVRGHGLRFPVLLSENSITS